MSVAAIDINNPDSYPDALVGLMNENSELFFAYQESEAEALQSRLKGNLDYLCMRNEYYSEYSNFLETKLLSMVKKQSIFGWHFTRLTESELNNIKIEGIIPSSSYFLETRLTTLVESGILSASEKISIIESSPLQNEQQRKSREGKFWFVSKKFPSDDGRVELLLNHWGGEVAYFWIHDETLKTKLQQIGNAKVIEATVPIDMIKQAHSASEAILANYLDPEKRYDINREFDFYIEKPLAPELISFTPIEELPS